MKQIHKKSAIPIYIAAGCWLIYGLIFPLYKLWNFLPPVVISAAAYFLASMKFKGKTVTVEDKQPLTGDKQVDALIRDKQEYLREIRSLNAAISDGEISEQLNRMEQTYERIMDYVIEKPEKVGQIRRFSNYYLPTTIKLLHSFERAEAQGIQGENIKNTMDSVKNIMGTIAIAFERQLDSLFADEALDISTDIVVLENMMSAEGLTENGGGKNNE